MRFAAIVLCLCLLALQGGSANPLLFPRLGAVAQGDEDNSASTMAPATAAEGENSPSTASQPTIPTNIPEKELQQPVVILAMDPNKLASASGDSSSNLLSAVTNLLKPVLSLPLNAVGDIYKIPLQGWNSVNGIVNGTLQIPKDVVNTGEKVVNDLLDTIGKL